jgi:chromosome segregation ATPase
VLNQKLTFQGQVSSRDHTLADKLQADLAAAEEKRQALLEKIKVLEMNLMEKSDIIKTMVGDASLAIKKYEIKLESNQEEIKDLAERLSDKEKVIIALKGEIALYND